MRQEVSLMGKVALLLSIFVLVGCGKSAERTSNPDSLQPETLTVAAAANLKFAFEEIETAFERRNPNIALVVTYGSSGSFFAQLSQQAPFDIFFSADTKYPQRLVDDGVASAESFFPYASGRIVVWMLNGPSTELDVLGIQAVIDPSIKKIAIANPRLAPYGAAAEEALKAVGIYDEAKERLVLRENITQTAQFVESGAADVGILA